MPEPVKFRGIVTYERYYNDTSFWGVFIVKTFDELPYSEQVTRPSVFDSSEDFEPHYIVTIAGKVQHLYVGSEYEFTANAVFNSKYNGWQYEPITVTSLAPSTYEASKMFLQAIISEKQAEILLKMYPNIVQEITN